MNWDKAIDISIPYSTDPKATSAWYVSPMKAEPVEMDGFVGSVAKGGSVNFRNLMLNPHGNGTHTECVGHIAPIVYSVNQHLKKWFFRAMLISVAPEQRGEDSVITLNQILAQLGSEIPEALIIRTMPNSAKKLHTHYSDTNPPFIEAAAAAWMCSSGIEHLLIDLPSVDKEKDDGLLAAHHAFWDFPKNPRMEATITELVYVPSEVADGKYMLNLQVAPIENDAAPSRPVILEHDW